MWTLQRPRTPHYQCPCCAFNIFTANQVPLGRTNTRLNALQCTDTTLKRISIATMATDSGLSKGYNSSVSHQQIVHKLLNYIHVLGRVCGFLLQRGNCMTKTPINSIPKQTLFSFFPKQAYCSIINLICKYTKLDAAKFFLHRKLWIMCMTIKHKPFPVDKTPIGTFLRTLPIYSRRKRKRWTNESCLKTLSWIMKETYACLI